MFENLHPNYIIIKFDVNYETCYVSYFAFNYFLILFELGIILSFL